MNPKVSVIIPVYNSSEYLRTCLDSIINQTLQNIEIICIDDGSTDSSLDIIKEYASFDKRIRYFTQTNKYAGVARNVGIEYAKGDYLVFLDSDDFFELTLLEKEYDKITTFNADICLCGADKYDTISQQFLKMPTWLNYKYITTEVFDRNTLKENLFNITSACPWTKMFSAKFIKKHKLEFQPLPRANDVFFVLSALVLAERIVAVDDTLIHYRVNNKNSLQSNNNKTPLAFISALSAVANRIDLKSADEYLKKGFSNIALGHIAYNLRALESSDSYDEFANVVSVLNTMYLEEFGLKNKTQDYFFNKSDLQYLVDKNIIKIAANENKISNSLIPESHDIMFSFIIPIFNCEAYIEECVLSISNQTYKNIEIICVDDASTDKTYEKLLELEQIDNRIKVVRHSSNKGAGGARNTGLTLAQGKYIWFIDGDDYIDSDALDHFHEIILQNNHNIDLIGFNADAFTVENGLKVPSVGGIKRNWPLNTIITLPRDKDIVPHIIEGSSVTYIAKKSFLKMYSFRENAVFEDADFSFKLYSSDKSFYMVDYVPYHRRIRLDSTTGNNASGLNEKCIKGRLVAAKVILSYIEENKINKKYALEWFKRWTRWASTLYISNRNIYTEEYHEIVQLLQKKLGLFSVDEVIEYREVVIPKILVSLTSIPSRVKKVDLVIKSLLNQTVPADKIILYLSSEEFKDVKLPDNLLGLEKINPKFSICYCDDLKPHKKYYYSMQEFPNNIIITVDDDIIYNYMLIENLIKSYVKHPNAVSCMRGHIIKMYDEETVAPYKKWIEEQKVTDRPMLGLLPTGVGGVLYPPRSIAKNVFNIERFKEVALYTDDLWLKWMQLKINTKSVLVQAFENLEYIEESQDNALWLKNINLNRNNISFKCILDSDNGLNILNANILNELYKERENLKVNHINSELEFYKKELQNIKSGYSFRLGRIITWFPRKFRGGIRCYKDNGFIYTIKRTLYHMKLLK